SCGAGPEDEGAFLSAFAVAGVVDDVARVGVHPHEAGDLAVDTGFLQGFTHRAFGHAFTRVHCPARLAQLPLSLRRINSQRPWSLRRISSRLIWWSKAATLAEGTRLLASGAFWSSR